jgi:GTP-binding protein
MDRIRVVESSFVSSANTTQSLPAPTLAEVAFGGRSNVGKSSVLNTIMERHNLVRAGGRPGTTRAINIFLARTSDGVGVHLVDLPGYGFSKVSKRETAGWGPLMEGYLRSRVTLRAVVLVVDVRRGVEPDDMQLIDFVRQTSGAAERLPVDTIVVATKIDKISRAAQKPALARVAAHAGVRVVGFSAVTAEGASDLWRALHATICRTS